jgi:hypothetical protein
MPKKASNITQITIHNKLSANYMTHHVDGAVGGFTPRGLISMSFFSERYPIPKSNEFSLIDGKVGDVISNSADSKQGIIREHDMGILMDINVAKEIVRVLNIKIDELTKALLPPKP